MANRLTIVVIGFNRPHSLARLLRSLSVAASHVRCCPPLLLSLDGGNSCSRDACLSLARQFKWPGRKDIIDENVHLGLKEHVLACGDLTQHTDAVLILEDDVCVSPSALHYADLALGEYGSSSEIAGISLYAAVYNEFCEMPFIPIDDGYDTYFIRTACSWGQIWTSAQWSGFRHWLLNAKDVDEDINDLPAAVISWPRESSWKRACNRYLVESGKYFVYPRFSYTTNMGEPGVHIRNDITYLTAPLSIGRLRLSFASLEDSIAKYDQFCVIEPESLRRAAPMLRGYDFDVDLTGSKSLGSLVRPLVLTCRKSPHPSLRSFGCAHFPPELDIV